MNVEEIWKVYTKINITIKTIINIVYPKILSKNETSPTEGSSTKSKKATTDSSQGSISLLDHCFPKHLNPRVAWS